MWCETKSTRTKKEKKKKFISKFVRKTFSNVRLVPIYLQISPSTRRIKSNRMERQKEGKLFRETKFRPMNQHHPLDTLLSINHPRWTRYSAHFLADRERLDTLVSRAQVSHRRFVSVLDCLSPRLYHSFFSPRGCLATTIATTRPIMWFIPR